LPFVPAKELVPAVVALVLPAVGVPLFEGFEPVALGSLLHALASEAEPTRTSSIGASDFVMLPECCTRFWKRFHTRRTAEDFRDSIENIRRSCSVENRHA
jgi:hypothetical protein